jgi:hypothetical protein
MPILNHELLAQRAEGVASHRSYVVREVLSNVDIAGI